MTQTRPDNSRFFSLVWLSFLVYPVVGIFSQPRSVVEYLYGLLIVLVFVGVFFWVYFINPWGTETRPLRLSSMVGMVWSYITLGMLFPLIGWMGLGLVIYAASFAGAQRSFVPSIVAMSLSFVLAVLLLVFGQIELMLALTMLIFSAVASISNHTGYREYEVQRQLRRSQEEVARVAKIAERERIARDLHDLLGHTLSVIVLKSELASRLSDKNPIKAALEIKEVERIARDALQEVRSAVRGYRSAGLESELQNVRLACEAANIKLELFTVPFELSWQKEQALAFALREATTNAIRHSHAKTLWVSLEPHDGEVHLSVWDDGSGQILEGNGIRGIRERLVAIGGRLELNHEHKGFTASTPLGAEPA
jgi:two-component system, NarL family, sensor histidine kinase DesK